MSQPYAITKRSAYHSWVPQSNATHNAWVKDLIKRALKRRAQGLGHTPAVQTFADSVTPDQRELFARALLQVGQYYSSWADTDSRIKDFDQFLDTLDTIVEAPPQFYKATFEGVTIGEPIGVPLYLTLDLLSNTSAAYTLFTQESFNKALRDLLDSWGEYLKTSDSNKTLTTDEWFSEAGMVVLQSGLGSLTFDQTYITEIDPPTRYKSWDSFFTRRLQSGVRPVVTSPGRSFLYNACECTVLRTIPSVRIHDTFWLKSQNYSLYDSLGGDDPNTLAGYADRLSGGSVYQAFLSPQDYHRWHSPIDGQVVKSQVFEGTYYAVLPDNGAPEYDTDLVPGDPHGALIRSQPWLGVSATRAVFILQPTSSSPIDLVAFVAIGMAEVSTCDVTVADGASVSVGDELGTFRFGGSSHLLIVKPKDGYNLVFQDYYNTPIRPGQHRWVNSVIGQLTPSSQ